MPPVEPTEGKLSAVQTRGAIVHIMTALATVMPPILIVVEVAVVRQALHLILLAQPVLAAPGVAVEV